MKGTRRIVIPGIPHHVVLHGARSSDVFRSDSDRRLYAFLLAECARRYGLTFWAWCLMTNHVHLVTVPDEDVSLGKGLGEAHRQYSRHFNAMQGLSGHLFKARFFSYPVQHDSNLLCVARYIELNPVTAGLADHPEEYPWSSARHHMCGQADPLVKQSPLTAMVSDWKGFLADGISQSRDRETIERHLGTGRPLGSEEWIARLEASTGRHLARRKPGPKPRQGG